jgi:hypothetical protein
MFELIREILKRRWDSKIPKEAYRLAKLEELAREFAGAIKEMSPEDRIRESFRLARIWLAELEAPTA